MNRRHTSTIVIALFTATAAAVSAQEPGKPSAVTASVQADMTKSDVSGPTTFGTDIVSYVVDGLSFNPFRTATTEMGSVAGSRYVTTPADRNVGAGVFLPSGAKVIGIELQGCDTNAAAEITVTLMSHRVSGGAESFLNHGSVGTGTAFSGGCAFFAAAITPITIDNFFRSYFVDVLPGAADATNTFQAVRIYYELQISPTPATATFSDVPVGHPFHRFVEALVSAGITGGCGGGNYCPNQAITRGQMAVFLATALGLHFPN